MEKIDFNECPHIGKIEQMFEVIQEQMKNIRQELKHNDELKSKDLSVIRDDIHNIGIIARENKKEIDTIKASPGKKALKAWHYIMIFLPSTLLLFIFQQLIVKTFFNS